MNRMERSCRSLLLHPVNPNDPVILSKSISVSPPSGSSLRQAFNIFRRDDDLAAETGVNSHVLQVRRLRGLLVQAERDSLPVGVRQVVVLLRPDGFGFHDERFAVGVERIGHCGFAGQGRLRAAGVASILAGKRGERYGVSSFT